MCFFHRGVQNVSSISTAWGYTWDSTYILTMTLASPGVYKD